MVTALLPANITAFASTVDSGTCGDNLTWTLDNAGTLTISGTGDMTWKSTQSPWYSSRTDIKSVTIKNGVTSVGNYAFNYCSNLKSIEIPKSITKIGNSAFAYCTSLTSIQLPNSITNIGDRAFSTCSGLTSITLPDKVTHIGTATFYQCYGLTSFTVPNGVTNIGSEAFSRCRGLTYVSIAASVIEIGNGAFNYCQKLTNIYVDEYNKSYCSQNGVLYNKEKTELVRYPNKSAISYTIPYGVTKIDTWAFCSCENLASLQLPNTVKEIDQFAFYGCENLTNINMPDSVTTIGSYIFGNCKALTDITLSKNITEISNSMFSGSGLASIVIPDSVNKIDDNAFANCVNLTNVTISKNVTIICNSAFSACAALSSITLPKSLTTVEDYAFMFCSPKNIYYNGTENDWKNVSIDLFNECLQSGPSKYFAYIKISDKDENTLIDTTQNMGEYVDTSAIEIPNGFVLKLYKDKSLTTEFDINTQINDNLTLYADFEKLPVGTKTTLSADGKKFTIKPINIESGNTVILALYGESGLVEMQSKKYSGEDIQFTTDKTYTTAKVMVWNSLENMTPICDVEIAE